MSFRRAFAAVAALLLLPEFAGPVSAQTRDITAGVAITDADTMQELEANGFALSALFDPGWTKGAGTPLLDNAKLAVLPAFQAVRAYVKTEFTLYNADYAKRFPESTKRGWFGIGTRPFHRAFDRNWLLSKAARFELVGVVNRMDRANRMPDACGEIRFIYRLAYMTMAFDVEEYPTLDKSGRPTTGVRLKPQKIKTSSRLPMTINLVLRAHNPQAAGATPAAICQELARRWIAAGNSGKRGQDLARLLMADGGALASVAPSQIDRIETNIQVTRAPSKVLEQFGGNAEYMLHIFKWDAATRSFSRARLENQIDRAMLLKSPQKLAAFKTWLSTPARLHQLVEGTIEIPDEFLAVRAVTSAPGGTARATNRPFLGIISPAEAAQMLQQHGPSARALDSENKLRSIASSLGLEQRLTDITCSGCHQSRAIGGFHFLGADHTAVIRELPQNSIFVAGSPHFYGDLPRRRAVVDEIAGGKPLAQVDFGRGFSMRPRRTGRGGKVIYPAAFDGLRNGWGSNCTLQPPKGVKKDASFDDWSCAAGLACRPMHESDHEPGFGICVHPVRLDNAARTGIADKANPEKSGIRIGDPFLFGELRKIDPVTRATATDAAPMFQDKYCMHADILNGFRAPAQGCLRTPGADGSGDYPAAYQGGGFFGGMHKRKHCADVPKGAVCGNEAGRHFTACAVGLTKDGTSSFVPCLTRAFASDKATLRACDVLTPCRDDYVCLATVNTPRTKLGACLPPYFLFQFRLDGHPYPPEGTASLR